MRTNRNTPSLVSAISVPDADADQGRFFESDHDTHVFPPRRSLSLLPPEVSGGQRDLQVRQEMGYLCMKIYEKPTRMSWWVLGLVAIREMLQPSQHFLSFLL